MVPIITAFIDLTNCGCPISTVIASLVGFWLYDILQITIITESVRIRSYRWRIWK